jgi:hypothetical protein
MNDRMPVKRNNVSLKTPTDLKPDGVKKYQTLSTVS